MKTILVNSSTLKTVQQTAPACVIALGFFDGVHLGHQKVIQVAKDEAKRLGLPLALMSFTTHPMNILSSGNSQIGQLTAIETKQQKLQQVEVDLFYLVEFTKEFAHLTPDIFVQEFLLKLQVQHAVAGFDYSYGKMGAGKLKEVPFYSNNQIQVTEVACMRFKTEKISSTAIRQRLQLGAVHDIRNFLGHSYRNKVKVQNGDIALVDETMLPIAGRYNVLFTTSEKSYEMEVTVDSFGVIRSAESLPFEGEAIIKWLTNKSLFLKISMI